MVHRIANQSKIKEIPLQQSWLSRETLLKVAVASAAVLIIGYTISQFGISGGLENVAHLPSDSNSLVEFPKSLPYLLSPGYVSALNGHVLCKIIGENIPDAVTCDLLSNIQKGVLKMNDPMELKRIFGSGEPADDKGKPLHTNEFRDLSIERFYLNANPQVFKNTRTTIKFLKEILNDSEIHLNLKFRSYSVSPYEN